MKIRQYIVTYKNPIVLHDCVDSIFRGLSDEEMNMLELNIINNHSHFVLDSTYAKHIKIHHNTLRPDISTGHLARDWNMALVNGFQDLTNPACDIVILTQHDVQFKPNYIRTLIRLHERYDMIQFGKGDACVSFTPQAIRRIGLFDERFNNIGYQEEDYFVRAKTYHSEKVSINYQLWNHFENWGVTHNPISSEENILKSTPNGYERGDPDHFFSMRYHTYGHILLWHKWYNPERQQTPGITSWIMYPYFEKDIETLREQRFIIPKTSWPLIVHEKEKTFEPL